MFNRMAEFLKMIGRGPLQNSGPVNKMCTGIGTVKHRLSGYDPWLHWYLVFCIGLMDPIVAGSLVPANSGCLWFFVTILIFQVVLPNHCCRMANYIPNNLKRANNINQCSKKKNWPQFSGFVPNYNWMFRGHSCMNFHLYCIYIYWQIWIYSIHSKNHFLNDRKKNLKNGEIW